MPRCLGGPLSVDSSFRFELVRKQWRVAIKREGPRKTLWKPNDLSVVCKMHFKPEDFKQTLQSLVAVGGRTRRDLKSGVVPSIFPHTVRHERQSHAAEALRQRVDQRRE
jgi:hypothetical protein